MSNYDNLIIMQLIFIFIDDLFFYMTNKIKKDNFIQKTCITIGLTIALFISFYFYYLLFKNILIFR